MHVLTVVPEDRMPPFIGDAISDGVYDGQLQSNPKHPVPVSTPSCWFVHVEDSEEHKFDTSWQVCTNVSYLSAVYSLFPLYRTLKNEL